MTQNKKRGVGRPSLGKKRMYFTLSPDVVNALEAMPAGERGGFVDDAVREKIEREKQ